MHLAGECRTNRTVISFQVTFADLHAPNPLSNLLVLLRGIIICILQLHHNTLQGDYDRFLSNGEFISPLPP